MSIIKSKDLIFEYKNTNEETEQIEYTRAVDGVDLDINEGDFVAILGHNGSGKSTIAKHINAILMPSEGNMWVDGMDTKDYEKIWDIRQSAGMVFQNPDNQIIGYTVEEDVAFGLENTGVPSEKMEKRVTGALEKVKMLHVRKKSPNNLSGGQKQRVAIAGVVAMRPKCIVLDEPTAMLDPSGRKEVVKTIKELNKKEGITIVLITHYMQEAIEADKVIVMDSGKVAMQGTPKEVFSNVEELKELGLEVPPVTEMAYRLKEEGIPLSDGILTIEEFVNELSRYRGK